MKDALELLKELVVATNALRRESVGGVLPEVSRDVKEETRMRFEEALQDASEFLSKQDLEHDLDEILDRATRINKKLMEGVTKLLKERGWPIDSSSWRRENLPLLEKKIEDHIKLSKKRIAK